MNTTSNSEKILYVVNDFQSYLNHRSRIVKSAYKAGYQCHVLLPHDLNQKKQLLSAFGPQIHFHNLRLSRKSKNPFKEIYVFLQICQKVKQLSPDILHNFTIKPVIYGTLAGNLFKVKKVINVITGLGSIYLKKNTINSFIASLISSAYKICFKGKNVEVVFQNLSDQSFFLDNNYVSSEKSHLIQGSGVDTSYFTPSPTMQASPPIILFSGRLILDKGISELLHACQSLKKKGVSFELHVCGERDPSNPSCMEKHTWEEWLHNDWLVWHGHSSNMREQYQNADIICLPSYREGLSMALLEGASCAKPLVTTNAPGCKEVVIPNLTGFIVPPREVLQLSQALEKLIQSPGMRNEMGKKGRLFVEENFSSTSITTKFIELYRKTALKTN